MVKLLLPKLTESQWEINMDIKEQLDNIFEFNDGEMTIHLNDKDSITVPAHLFVNSVMSKLEDYLIFAPYNGKDINWIDSEHPDFKYADDNTYWGRYKF